MPKGTAVKRKETDEEELDTPEPVATDVSKLAEDKTKPAKHRSKDELTQKKLARKGKETEQTTQGPPKKKAKKTSKPEPLPKIDPDDEEANQAEEADEAEEVDEVDKADEAEEADEADEADEREDEKTLKKKARAKMRRNKKAKLVGYRSLARSAGYIDRVKGDTVTVAGIDGTSCLISIADARRLMRFAPTTVGSTSYGTDEVAKRHNLFTKGVPASVARETQARCDAAMRSAMNQAVLRAAEAGKKTISASIMMSVLRPYRENMLFTAVVPPIGLIRHAQSEGVINATEADKELMANEKKENQKHKKMHEDYEKAEKERLAKLRESRQKKAAA